MSVKLFIAGTDTHVGKTHVCVNLLKMFSAQGLSTIGIKPVASGCLQKNNKIFSTDALHLQQNSSVKLDYDAINPFAFIPAIAPHIAANIPLNVGILNQTCGYALNYPADICLIEGAGGWCVPLNADETLADFAVTNKFKVILVVGIRLGCINHAILTVRAMLEDGADVIGWIANCVDPKMECIDQNIETLRQWLPIQHIGTVPYHTDLNQMSTIDLNTLCEMLELSREMM